MPLNPPSAFRSWQRYWVKNKVEIQLGKSRNDLNKILAAYEQGPQESSK